MDPVTMATYILNAIEIGSAFLNKIGHDTAIEDAYYKLIKRLERVESIPPTLQNQLKEHSDIEKNELKKLLINYEVGKDLKAIEAAQKLVELVEQQDEKLYAHIEKQMEVVYLQHLDEAKKWSRFSMVAVFLGFLLIIAGITAIYLINITTGIVVTVSGIIINLTSALFFRQAASANEQANNKYEKLIELKRIQSSIKILSSVNLDTNSSLKKAL